MPEENDLEKIKKTVDLLSENVRKNNERIYSLESKLGVSGDLQNMNKDFVQEQKIDETLYPPPPPPLPDKQFEKEKEKEKVGLEEKIGGKWFAKIGVLALVLGVSFLLKYAFDNNWIGETGRVVMGIMAGLALLAVAEKTIRKYSHYGQMLAGGGIVMLYLSIFAAFNFYHLIPQMVAFLLMSVITAVGIALSLRYDVLPLMIMVILGGFLTPFLISTGKNNQIELLSYILLLDLAILFVSFFKKWRELNFVGFIGTVFVFAIWAEKFYTKSQLGSTFAFLILFFIVYSISSLIYNLVKKEKSSGTEQLLTIFNAVVFFAASYALLDDRFHIYMGFFAVIVGIYYFLWAYLVREITPDDNKLYDFLGFLTVGFATLAIALQFEQNIITIGWTIEALLLLYLGLKTKQESIEYLGLTVSGLALCRLLFIDSFLKVGTLVFNKRFFTFLAAIAAFYLAGYLYRILRDNQKRVSWFKNLIILFFVAANFLTIFAGSQEVMGYYSRQVDQFYKQESQSYEQIGSSYYSSYRYENGREEIEKLKNSSSVALSVFWLIYAIVLLTIGFVKKYKLVRFGGVGLSLLAILKLFFYDLWGLGTLYRIISSIVLGVVLLSISFAYQKYKDKIKEII